MIRLTDPADYLACRAGFAARGMGADTLGPPASYTSATPNAFPPYDPAQVIESFLDRDRALRLVSSDFTAEAAGAGRGAVRVVLRNTGFVDLAVSVEITPAVPAAVAFPGGTRQDLGTLVPEQPDFPRFGVVVNACLLPPHPTQPGFQAFDYTVKMTSPGVDEVTREETYHVAVPSPAGC